MDEEGSSKGTPSRGLYELYAAGGDKVLHFVCELPEQDLATIRAAEVLVRRIARSNPYHHLAKVRERLTQSLAQAADQSSTEHNDVRGERLLNTIQATFEEGVRLGDAWIEWVAETVGLASVDDSEHGPLEDSSALAPGASSQPTLSDIAEQFATGVVVKLASGALSATDTTIVLSPVEMDATVQSTSAGLAFPLSQWLSHLNAHSIMLADAGLREVDAVLARASRQLMEVWTEVAAGTPVIANVPTQQGDRAELQMELIDVGVVREAHSQMRQAGTLAQQARKSLGLTSSSAGTVPKEAAGGAAKDPLGAPTEAGGPDTTSADRDALRAEPLSTGPSVDQNQAAELAEVDVDLGRALDAIVAHDHALSAQWNSHFDTFSFTQALDAERALAQTVVQSLLRRIQVEGEKAAHSGLDNRLPQYPVPLEQIASWSSGDSTQAVWTYQSTATVLAFQTYTQALQQLDVPVRATFGQDVETPLEFEPLRAAALHGSGRLLIDLMSENAATLDELASTPGVDRPENDHHRKRVVAELTRGARLSQQLGLPEAELLYLLRLAAVLTDPAGHQVEDHAGTRADGYDDLTSRLVERARCELRSFLAGNPVSRGLLLMQSDALADVLGDALEARLNATYMPHPSGHETSPPPARQDDP